MRPDMAKVITERPRRAGEADARKFGHALSKDEIDRERHEDAERGGLVASSRARRRHPRMQTDLLGPLRRFLRKQVGRPWDKVVSELSAQLDRRTLDRRHVFDHVECEVATHATIGEGGEIVARDRWSHGLRPVRGLYVHPRTGLLRIAEPKHARTRWVDRFRRDLGSFGIPADGPHERLLAYRIDGLRVWEKKGSVWFIHEYRERSGARRSRRSRTLVRTKQASRAEMDAAGQAWLNHAPF
jgi:hypothetical protein